MDTSAYSLRLRNVLEGAVAVARRHRHEYVGTEHQLLALLAERDGVTPAVLDALDVDAHEVVVRVDTVIGKGQSTLGAAEPLPLTSRANKVLQLMTDAARELQHSYVSTEHLLLGIIREKNGVAAQVLIHAGLTDALVKAEVLRIVGTHG